MTHNQCGSYTWPTSESRNGARRRKRNYAPSDGSDSPGITESVGGNLQGPLPVTFEALDHEHQKVCEYKHVQTCPHVAGRS